MPRRTRSHALAALPVLCALALLAPAARAQTHDPRQVWSTYETAHFRVHHYQGLEAQAERVAAIGEGIYQRVGALMGWHPQQVTEIVLTDNTDDSNGRARAVPYNWIDLFVTSPEDMSILSDYDDWLQGLLIHEYTHVAHTDNISGLPRLINAIFGKVYPPNNVQPSWVLEGIAVYAETRFTTGGRLRSTIWDMYLRGDALAGRLATLDQVSSGPNRWPHGHIAYLYGSYFIQYLADRFGEDFLARLATDYGGQVIPFGFNRSLQRATGHTFEEVYGDFLQSVRERYERQRAAIEARGLIEGERITFQGEEVQYPRFLPDGHTVAYQSRDGSSHAQIRTIDVAARVPRPHDGDWVDTFQGFALDSTGTRMILSDTGFHRHIYFYRDLYERRAHLRDDGVLETTDNRAITDGARAMYPDIAPDDDHVAFTVNHRGTMTLFEMSLAERRPVPLLRVQRYEQVYTPRYSPDGAQIVFSHWRRGGFRDIRVLDRATGAVRDLTHDRAVDMHPVFSPDGRYVVWSSDRTGVANLYAYELATGRVRQVTNVVHGAFMPAISPDGRTLVYVGYTALGFDLFRMPFDPARWIEPGEELPRRGDHIPAPPVVGARRPYSPWWTLRPQYWSVELGSDGFGTQVAVSTQGRDVVGNHSYNARVAVGLVRGDPSFDVTYYYSGLRPTLRVHAYRAVTGERWRVGTHEPLYASDRWGGETEVSVGFPALFLFHTLSFAYEAQYVTPLGGLPFGPFVDPNEPAPLPPFRGWNAGVRASWHFSRAPRYAYDISRHEGYDGFLSAHATDRALGSADGSFDLTWAVDGYVPLPWGQWRRSHVLALRLSGGFGVRDGQPRPLFYLGGFPTYQFTEFITALATLSASSGVALRGYPQFSRAGDQFHLLNVEYRFPIVQIDRGPSTNPVYLSRLYGGAFCDVGNAFFGRFRASDLAVGVGAELLADVIFGYYLPYTVRFGLAQGLTGDDATLQGYALFSSPF
jgi:hypothetical protein